MSKEELEKLNIDELKARLEEREHDLWMHNMIDHFTLEDIKFRDKLQNEISDIRWLIKEKEGAKNG